MRLLVLLYNCIVFGNPDFRHHVLQANPPYYLNRIGPTIDARFIECQSGNPGLLRLYQKWKSEEPIEIAAAEAGLAAAEAGLAAKKRQEKLNQEVKAESKKKDKNSDVRTSEVRTSDVRTIGRRVGPGARVAEAVKIAANIRNVRVSAIRNHTPPPPSGGTRNNHTRRNKNKRKKNSKSKTKFKPKSSSKYKKVIPSSRSGSQSNRKKSKPKKSQKNVTFKRRRARK
jgi:hypothetical protein